MKNFYQSGEMLTVTAPYQVSSGGGVLVGSLFGIAAYDAANGTPVDMAPEGVFDITALNTDTGTVGTKMYWDNTNKRVTTTATSNTLIGVLTATKNNGDATARVYLDGCIR
jgi:predicted RecA/RadA family phage recombinase